MGKPRAPIVNHRRLCAALPDSIRRNGNSTRTGTPVDDRPDAWLTQSRHFCYLISQHVTMTAALRDMYQRLLAANRWEGAPLKETLEGSFSINEILLRLGHTVDTQSTVGTSSPEDDLLQQELGLIDLGETIACPDATRAHLNSQSKIWTDQCQSFLSSSDQSNPRSIIYPVSTSLEKLWLDPACPWLSQGHSPSSAAQSLCSSWSDYTQSSGSFRSTPDIGTTPWMTYESSENGVFMPHLENRQVQAAIHF